MDFFNMPTPDGERSFNWIVCVPEKSIVTANHVGQRETVRCLFFFFIIPSIWSIYISL